MQERGVIKKKRRVDDWKRAEEMRWKESADGRWCADKSRVVSVIVISRN